jgi:2-amino-4-hydroxy-6-hydroxymethyldihydropteridine diphosphokinase
MPRVYLGIGSNIEPQANIRSGLQTLRERYGTLSVSTVYRTEAIGFEGDDFYNLVVGFDTGLPLRTLAKELREIEYRHGRRRDETKYSSRRLDIDILLYGHEILHDQGIDVPRSDISRYYFVLGPLVELDPALRHPETGVELADLWADMTKDPISLCPVELDL